MIEIIKKGTKTTVRCAYCGCLFSYEAEDKQHRPSPIYKGSSIIFVQCPQCQEDYIIEQPR